MNTRRGRAAETEVDWVADPPPPARRTAVGATWWGVRRSVAVKVSVILLALSATGVALWTLAPTPQPVPVPEDFLTAGAIPASDVNEPEPEPAPVLVHVAGAVNEPGLVEMPSSGRVAHAIDLAGGPTPQADLGAINLAAPASDGQQVYVPAVGETPPTVAGTADEAGLINLNSADAAELQQLPGIGPVMAERILEHRAQHGPFTDVEELIAVPGIGPAAMSRLRTKVSV